MSVTSIGPGKWQWRGIYQDVDWLLEVDLADGQVCVESGPAAATARSHEAVGGTQSYKDFLADPSQWVEDLPDLAEWVTKVVKMKVSQGQP